MYPYRNLQKETLLLDVTPPIEERFLPIPEAKIVPRKLSDPKTFLAGRSDIQP
jgi:hypothetical protein